MVTLYKVVYEGYSGFTKISYYKSTSISALMYWLGYQGAAVGNIIEIKRVNRLPKSTEAIDTM